MRPAASLQHRPLLASAGSKQTSTYSLQSLTFELLPWPAEPPLLDALLLPALPPCVGDALPFVIPAMPEILPAFCAPARLAVAAEPELPPPGAESPPPAAPAPVPKLPLCSAEPPLALWVVPPLAVRPLDPPNGASRVPELPTSPAETPPAVPPRAAHAPSQLPPSPRAPPALGATPDPPGCPAYWPIPPLVRAPDPARPPRPATGFPLLPPSLAPGLPPLPVWFELPAVVQTFAEPPPKNEPPLATFSSGFRGWQESVSRTLTHAATRAASITEALGLTG